MTKLVAALYLALAAGSTFGQAFPTKPVRVVIGLPGGVVELTFRLAAVEMAKRLGQPVVVEIMAGASATIAGNHVVNARPDGYTLYYGSTSAMSPLFNKNNGVDAAKSLAPVSNFASVPYIVYANAKLPVQSMGDLVAWSKANPGKLNLGSGAVNAAILGSVLAARTGLVYVNIPYKGSGQLAPALISGDVGFTITASSSNFTPHVRAGSVRALFVTKNNRFAVMSNVPTSAEFGVPDLVALTNMGLWAPLTTPKEIIQQLSAAGIAAVKLPEVQERFRSEAIAAEPEGSTPEELLRAFAEEMDFWREAARISKYRPD
jgi:tripartite-type tricarboxylate transporter receptor subunit TctC